MKASSEVQNALYAEDIDVLVLGSELAVPKVRSLAPLIDPKIYIGGPNSFKGKLSFQLPLITFQHKKGSTTLVNLTYNPLQSSLEQFN